MPAIPAAYRAMLEQHYRRLQRLATRGDVVSLKRLYDDANDALMRRIARTAGRETFTAAQARALAGQVKSGLIGLTRRLEGALGEASLAAQTESIRALARGVAALEKKFTGASIALPVEEAARFRGVIDKSRTSLLRAHKTSMARYGARLVTKMERQISLSLMTGQTGHELAAGLRDVADLEWYQGERIARTEIAWAYNAGHADGIADAARELPDLWMRWSEHVDDVGYEPLDDRVAVDSEAMHGQVAAPGSEFVMPPTNRKGEDVPADLVGKRWPHPPNRPNDRAVLAPWRPHWGVPGWVWRRGRRVDVRAELAE
jgi:hypothetical protein